MCLNKRLVCFATFFLLPFLGIGQRIYTPNSILANGNWYKISVEKTGIYKIDIPFLASLGINTSGLASGSIRLYGNGGIMLAEANEVPRLDDLTENAIQVVDGGDGVINGSDYILSLIHI